MKLFQDFMATLKRVGLEYYHKYYSVYPGVVMDNKDPEQRGRILIKIPSILGDINGGLHPKWVGCVYNDSAGNQTGSFHPPYVGDIVDVMFRHGDINYPVYKGGSWSEGELPADFTAGYPNVRGWVFKSGQKIIIDETSGAFKIKISNPSGSQVVIDDTEKSITMADSAGDSVSMKDGTITITDKGGDVLQMTAGTMTGTVKDMVKFMTKQMVLGDDVMSAVLGENLESWADAHTHIWPGGLLPAPTTPPIVPNSARTGTALDYKSQFIKLKGN
jgi:uncharacterized protein involved in type VI secretion and phage assembly